MTLVGVLQKGGVREGGGGVVEGGGLSRGSVGAFLH